MTKYVFFALMVLLPLPFGGARPAWVAAVMCLVGLMGVVTSLRLLRRPVVASPTHLGAGPLLMPVLIGTSVLFIWGLFQQLSLSGTTLSINPPASLLTASQFLCYLVATLLVFYMVLENRIRMRSLFYLISYMATAYACYGLVEFFSQGELAFWFDKSINTDALNSTFVNRNNFSTFAGIGAVATFAVIQHKASMEPTEQKGRWSAHVFFWLASSRGIYILCFILIMTATLLTGSRGGFLSALVGIGFFALFGRAHQSNGQSFRRSPQALVTAGAILLLFWLSGDQVLSRFLGSTASHHRLDIFLPTITAIGDNPILGYGLGTFSDFFPSFRSFDQAGVFYNRTHNDYLEVAVTTGLPVAFVFFAGLGLMMYRMIKTTMTLQRGRTFAFGGISAIFVVATHSMADFPMQIPAIALLFSSIAGATMATLTKSSWAN